MSIFYCWCDRAATLTLSLHGLSQPSSGGRQQCSDAFRAAQTGRSEQHSELIRAQVEIRTQSGLQQTVERRQTHRPATHTSVNNISREPMFIFMYFTHTAVSHQSLIRLCCSASSCAHGTHLPENLRSAPIRGKRDSQGNDGCCQYWRHCWKPQRSSAQPRGSCIQIHRA